MSSVPLHLDLMGAALDRAPNVLKRLGDLETRLLKYDIEEHSIEQPIFISGLARSGSTILLEILNSHDDVTSYQYRDYPFIHANYFWNTVRALIPHGGKKVERAHKDRIMVNAQSPEALDEILWMSFFDDLHDPSKINTLNSDTHNPEFENFYKNSLLKLLALRNTKRIALKNNYSVARLLYLQKLFPDARFIIPIRKPEDHIASLMKQHTLIKTAQENDPRAVRYMRRHGHFEFGTDIRPLNFGEADKILNALDNSHIIEAFALSWDQTYRHVFEKLQNNPKLKAACHIVKYDKLCAAPKNEINNLLEFCSLEQQEQVSHWANEISSPTYYNNDFSDEDRALIKEITNETAALYWEGNT